MIFNSYSFILIFLPVCVLAFYLCKRLNRPVLTRVFLLCASLFFYGFHNYKSFALLIISILLNFGLATILSKSESGPGSNEADAYTPTILSRIILTLGIVLDLGLLIYCKYLLFFADLTNSIFHTGLTFTQLIMPLGISFFTFSQIAYLVDVYRAPDKHVGIIDYALYVSFFPKVTVGPIALSSDFIPMLNEGIAAPLSYDHIARGMVGLSFGIAKKVLIADTLSKLVDWGYLHISTLGTTNAVIVMLAYTMQIYFDFSGYCDMARGICCLMGLDLPVNFNSPYRSLSIGEFWKRWHITLTTFFRKYVYFPLGGNRKGKVRTYFNQMFIFLISGLWHGASLNFILWGLMHGIGSVFSKVFSKFTAKMPRILRWLVTFSFVNLAWITFRAADLAEALTFYKQLFTGGFTALNMEMIAAGTPIECNLLQWCVLKFTPVSPTITGSILVLGFLLFTVYASIGMRNSDERMAEFKPGGKLAAICTILLVLSILSLSEVTKFIYVNF